MRPPRIVMRASAAAVSAVLAAQLDVPRARVVATASLADDLGVTPLSLMRAVLALEEAFDISISDDVLGDVTTVEDVMRIVARARPRSSSLRTASTLPPARMQHANS